MLTRIFIAVFLCLMLSGCILQSEQPVFAEKDGGAFFAPYGTQFASYSPDKAGWKTDDETLTFTPVGKHYVGSAGKDTIEVLFVPIAGNWWAMQAMDKDQIPGYALAEARPGEILIYPVACKPLLTAGTFAAFIEFKDDDCLIRKGADVNAMFKLLATMPGDTSNRLVPLP